MALSAEAMKRELHQHSKRLRGLFSFAVQPSLIALLLVLLIWMVCFTTIQILEDTKRLDAEQDVANVARVFEEHVARASRETDRTLLFLRTTYESDPSKFNLGKWVLDPEFKSELLVQFALIDPQGMMVESNVGSLDKPINLSDREHFLVHVNASDDKLFVSKPVLGRASGKWSIQLSRRIRGPDGKFGGVLVGSIDPAFLANFYDGISLGPNAVTTLVGFDGVVRARAGGAADVLGRSILKSTVFEHVIANRSGIISDVDPIDGVLRVVGYRVVSGFPLVVMVGIPDVEIRAQNSFNKKVCLLVAIAITLLIIALMLAMHRRFRLAAKVELMAADRDRLDVANKTKSEFLAVMSHEIRTPLNAILGLSSTLLEKDLPANDHALVKLINQEGDRLLVILNDILDYSKLESGKLNLEPINFCITDIASSVVKIAGPRGTAKGLRVECVNCSSLPKALLGDAGRLRQVMLNLVSNAIKFTPSGSVTIYTRCIEVVDGRAKLEWSIRDTGIGIAPEHLRNLFHDFVQAHSSINKCFGGSGLGLAISRRIARQMDGDITIKSILGTGTDVIVTFKLPVADVLIATEPETDHANAALHDFFAGRERKPKILIVDDSSTNRLVASEMLKEFEFATDFACDGLEAVTAASKFRYDLILMDVRMPEMDGLEATKIIRSFEGDAARVPVIAFTANAFAEDVATCLAAGMNGFVSKPVRKLELLKAIATVLKLSKEVDYLELPSPATAASVVPEVACLPLLEFDHTFNESILEELIEAIGPERARKAIQLFEAETESRLAILRKLTPESELVAFTREAHSIKGISTNFGFTELSKIAAHLEQNAASLTSDDCRLCIDAMEKSFGHARKIMVNCTALAA